jgi:hypothetical protein
LQLQQEFKLTLSVKEKIALFGRKIKSFPCITIGSIGRHDVSYYDSGDVYAGDDDNLQDLIQSCIGNDVKRIIDVDHLIAHIINKRDIFVTSDTDDFIKHRDCLEQKCSIKIMTPEECINFLKSQT